MKLGVRSVYTSWVLVAMIAAVVMMTALVRAAPRSAAPRSAALPGVVTTPVTGRERRYEEAVGELTALWCVINEETIEGEGGISIKMAGTLRKLIRGKLRSKDAPCVVWRDFVLYYVEKHAKSKTESHKSKTESHKSNLLREVFEAQKCMALLQSIAEGSLKKLLAKVENGESAMELWNKAGLEKELSDYSTHARAIIDFGRSKLTKAYRDEVMANAIAKVIPGTPAEVITRTSAEGVAERQHSSSGDDEHSRSLLPGSQHKKPNVATREAETNNSSPPRD